MARDFSTFSEQVVSWDNFFLVVCIIQKKRRLPTKKGRKETFITKLPLLYFHVLLADFFFFFFYFRADPYLVLCHILLLVTKVCCWKVKSPNESSNPRIHRQLWYAQNPLQKIRRISFCVMFNSSPAILSFRPDCCQSDIIRKLPKFDQSEIDLKLGNRTPISTAIPIWAKRQGM